MKRNHKKFRDETFIRRHNEEVWEKNDVLLYNVLLHKVTGNEWADYVSQ